MTDTPTVYTIAQRAGVSIATVSRVLNESPKVAEATRQRVLKVIQQLDYRPNPSARGLALDRTDIIALLFPDLSGPYYSEVIRGVETETSRQHYNVVIYGTHGKASNAHFLNLLPGKVDGLILMARSVDDAYVLDLQRQKIPFVLLSRVARSKQIVTDCILTDNQGGAFAAVTHLLEHGHRKVAFISGPANSPDSQARLRGYERALEARGIRPRPEWVQRGDFRQASGQQAMSALLGLPRSQTPTAIFAGNDEMALGAIGAAQSRGLCVPDDLAVIGFDDIQVASLLQPGLTTVRQPIHEMGELAVQRLLQRIKNPEQPGEVIHLPTEFVVRRSCGCA